MTKKGNQTGHEIPDPVIYNPGYSDGGDAPDRDPLLVPGSGQDISQKEKTTLGNYLSSLTAGRVGAGTPSSFRVPGGSSSTDGIGHSVSANASTNQGPALTLSQMRSAGTTNGTFLDLTRGLNQNAADKFNDTKNSEYSFRDNPFKDTDIKRYDSENRKKGFDGNSLLPSIRATGIEPSDLGAPNLGDVPEDAPLVQKKISAVLRANRFNSIERSFVKDKQLNRDPRDQKISLAGYTIQKKMGKFDQFAPEVRSDKVDTVSTTLLLEAAGTPGGKDFLGGIPIIDASDLRAQSVAVTDDKDNNTFFSSNYTNDESSVRSYGTMNSPIDRFSNMSSLSTIKSLSIISSAIRTFIEIVKIIEKPTEYEIGGGKIWHLEMPSLTIGVDVIPQNMRPTFSKIDFSGAPGYTLSMGKRARRTQSFPVSTSLAGQFAQEIRKITPFTEHTLSDCINKGQNILLGKVSSDSPGYIGAIALKISRGSYTTMADALSNVGSSLDSFRNLNSNILTKVTSVTSVISDTIAAFRSLFQTDIYRFIVALAQMGDRALTAEEETVSREANRDFPVSPDVRIQASRISEFGLVDARDLGSRSHNALAWKHSSSPSEYILPSNFSKAINDFIQIPGYRKTIGGLSSKHRKNRISPEAVREIENALESEYMPFYFHDLRTNEIISFHAFLSDLSDGFTANYTSTAGYGRADEIMTYNNTKRSITFTFSVAATSQEDMDVMYWNINKLISMLYPQYSRGRAIKSGSDRFIQPFSQIPTASPMIRLRIGDVIRSNYSKFGIARLFGLGEPEDVFSPRPPVKQAQTVAPENPATPAAAEAPITSVPLAQGIPISYRKKGDIITIKPGVSTRRRFIENESGMTLEDAQANYSALQDAQARAIADNYTANLPSLGRDMSASTANALGTDVANSQSKNPYSPTSPNTVMMPTNTTYPTPLPPRIPIRFRTFPRGCRAEIVGIAQINTSVDRQTIYRCVMTKIPITRTEYRQAPFSPASMEYLQQRARNLLDDQPIHAVETGREAPTGVVTTSNFVPQLGRYNEIDLTESEIMSIRSATNNQNDDSPDQPENSSRIQILPTIDLVGDVDRAETTPTPSKTLDDFLSSRENGNPVIRSFESTRGRGLAGFITDMKFDWNESTWEIDAGYRAPKYMKISISFSPIHDIPMGLDSSGMVRSVAYNVGEMSRTIGDDPYDS